MISTDERNKRHQWRKITHAKLLFRSNWFNKSFSLQKEKKKPRTRRFRGRVWVLHFDRRSSGGYKGWCERRRPQLRFSEHSNMALQLLQRRRFVGFPNKHSWKHFPQLFFLVYPMFLPWETRSSEQREEWSKTLTPLFCLSLCTLICWGRGFGVLGEKLM